MRFCGFAKGKTADGSNQRFEARHLAGELAPRLPACQKVFFDKLEPIVIENCRLYVYPCKEEMA